MHSPMSIANRPAPSRRLRNESGRLPSRSRRTATAMLVAIATALSLALAGAGSAGAATIASGLVFSDGATQMICSLLNVGSTPVKVLSSKMTDGSGGNLLGYNGCFKKTLQPLEQCGFVVGADQGAGIFEIDASKGHVRGLCQLNKSGVAIAVTEMH